MAEKRKKATEFIEKVKGTVSERLQAAGLDATLEGRIKRLYSIHQKLRRQRIDLEQVYDFVALRIVVPTIPDCYAALGVLHNLWRPVPGRIKDFIAMPRPNGYQSLHTSVIGDEGHPFEVQIRTREMHRIADEGIAAHWKYKEGRTGYNKDDQAFAWLRQLLEWQQEVKDPHEFLNSLKLDLYPEEVYCFTPAGEVKTLPRGATPVDFAYAVHTEVGHQCVGARVNGKMVPLRYKLKNGDIVEILTAAGHHPSRDWLTFTVTNKARGQDPPLPEHGGEGAGGGDRQEALRPRAEALRPLGEEAGRRRRWRRWPTSSASGTRSRTCSRPSATARCRCARCWRAWCPPEKLEAPPPRRSRARSPTRSSACCGWARTASRSRGPATS